MSSEPRVVLELEQRADDAVRGLALRRLDDAQAALVRLGTGKDAEALHDLRVALRRLRSVLESYPELFGSGARKRVLRGIRRIGKASGAGRDAEAQLAWIQRQLRSRAAPLRAARAELERSIAARAARALARAQREVVPDFLALASELREDAGRGEAVAAHAGTESFGRASGRRLAEAAEALREGLARVHSLADGEAAHRARIAAKRVRYLLEPLQEALPAAHAALRQLRELQDQLGELNDLRSLRALVREQLERAALQRAQARLAAVEAGEPEAGRGSPSSARVAERIELGCLATSRAIETRRHELFRSLESWLGGAEPAFFGALQALLEPLQQGAAHAEIERKFLLAAMPELPPGAEVIEIEQGYVGKGDVPERLRRASTTEGVRYYRTVKVGRGLQRAEFEQVITREEFERRWPATQGCRVHKRRHRVRADADGASAALVWEIDEFRDRPLVLAELELAATEDAFEIPHWLAPVLLREVTDESGYTNLSLARREF